MKRIKFLVVCIVLICSKTYTEEVVFDEFVTFTIEGDDIWIGTKNDGVVLWNQDVGVKQVLTVADGLVDPRINSIVIDHNGIKWFGTENGLSRFDGTNWTTFTEDNGLTYHATNSLAIDHDNTLWVGTYGGLSSWDGNEWTIHLKESGIYITRVVIDNLNRRWIVFRSGLWCYHDNEWDVYNISDGIMTYHFMALAIDHQNRPWISCYTITKSEWSNHYLQHYNGEKFEVIKEIGYYYTSPFSTIYIDEDDEKNGIWYDNWENLIYFDGVKEFKFTFPLPAGDLRTMVLDMEKDANGLYWMIVSDAWLNSQYLLSFDGAEFSRHDIVLEGVSVDEIPEEIPTVSVYPNPFNPVTWIAFNLAAPGHVRLTIYDTTGAAVKTLIDKRLGAGTHEKVFDGSGMANGPYFYRLEEENGGVRTGKMMLVK